MRQCVWSIVDPIEVFSSYNLKLSEEPCCVAAANAIPPSIAYERRLYHDRIVATDEDGGPKGRFHACAGVIGRELNGQAMRQQAGDIGPLPVGKWLLDLDQGLAGRFALS